MSQLTTYGVDRSPTSLPYATVRPRYYDGMSLCARMLTRTPSHRSRRPTAYSSQPIAAQRRCGHGRRACLPFSMAVAGPHRILRIVLSVWNPAGREAIRSIAHELRHALEVLEEPGITRGDFMYFFYKSRGSWRGEAFETVAAVDAGNAVRQELRKRRPHQTRKISTMRAFYFHRFHFLGFTRVSASHSAGRARAALFH